MTIHIGCGVLSWGYIVYTKLGRFLPKSEQIQRKFLQLLKLKKKNWAYF